MQSLSTFIKYFKLCYYYAGKRIFVLVFLNLFAGILGGLGIVLIFPLLTPDSESTIGKFIAAVFNFLGLEQTISNVLLLMLGVFSIKGLLSFCQQILAGKITTDIGREIRNSLVKQYSQMNYTFYTNTNVGYLNDVITKEVDSISGAISLYCLILTCVIYTIVYIPPAIIMNYQLGLLLLAFASVYFITLKPLNKESYRASVNVTKQNIQMHSLLIQTISHLKYIKATNSFASLHKKLTENIHHHSKFVLKQISLGAIATSLIEPFSVLVLCTIIYLEVVMGGKPVAEILVIMAYLYKALGEILLLQSYWQKFNGILGGVEAVEEIRNTIDNNMETQGGKKITSFEKQIVFSGVGFYYGDKQILKNIDITIEKNSCIGIVGESGGGKTTLFDLITALISPSTGKISIDGNDYRKIDQASLRSLIGYVTQDSVMFHDTIANNISLWNCDREKGFERITQTAQTAYCDDFIGDTENGYQTIVGDNGIKLSGGQKQRLAIARELFKAPQIIIFDEATSALDTKSEQHIQQSINAIRENSTVVIISHRLSSVYNCDRIYVIADKTVVEQGNFNELYADKNSLFHRMCVAQNIEVKI